MCRFILWLTQPSKPLVYFAAANVVYHAIAGNLAAAGMALCWAVAEHSRWKGT